MTFATGDCRVADGLVRSVVSQRARCRRHVIVVESARVPPLFRAARRG
jgi:hypothetical protein